MTNPSDQPRLAAYGQRWEIEANPGGLDVWYATRQRGTETRVIVAFSAPELAAKLAAIEAADGTAPQRPATAS